MTTEIIIALISGLCVAVPSIITTMSKEFTVIEELMKNIEVIEKHNLKFYCGLINKKEVALRFGIYPKTWIALKIKVVNRK